MGCLEFNPGTLMFFMEPTFPSPPRVIREKCQVVATFDAKINAKIRINAYRIRKYIILYLDLNR